jgi:hypothetical protein
MLQNFYNPSRRLHCVRLAMHLVKSITCLRVHPWLATAKHARFLGHS